MKVRLLEPWEEAINPKALEQQLRNELSSPHALFNKNLSVIGRRNDCDDVLFVDNKSDEYFIVHLTWGAPDLNGYYPRYVYINSVEKLNALIVDLNSEY